MGKHQHMFGYATCGDRQGRERSERLEIEARLRLAWYRVNDSWISRLSSEEVGHVKLKGVGQEKRGHGSPGVACCRVSSGYIHPLG